MNSSTQGEGGSVSDNWYQTAVMYAVDVSRFSDSDGDGWGDLRGVIDRLDYISSLGVTCLWLLPFFPSPRLDNGYDVADYYSVDPRLGTLDDFGELVRSAGERGIRVMIDLVMNHTSDTHPWFRASRRSERSRYRSYYIWESEPPPVPRGRTSAFPGEEDSLWTFDEVAGKYYYHVFYRFQPQLDAGNPAVREEFARIMDFWLSMGACGFRLDAVPIMVGPDDALNRERRPDIWLREFRSAADALKPCVALLGEVDLHADELVEYFGQGDQLNMLLNFYLNAHLFEALATSRKDPLLRAIKQLPATPPSGQWVNFLRNLDELNLSWIPSAERETVYQALDPDGAARVYGRGIRRRLAPMLGGDRRKIELTFSLMLSLPGTPLIVYGDEIGLGDDLAQQGRSAVRVPMQWDAGENGGFSAAPAPSLVQAAVAQGPFCFGEVNVEAQEADPRSLLNWMRVILGVRRGCDEFGLGSWHVVETESPHVIAHVAKWRNGTVVAVHNLADASQEVSLDVTSHSGEHIVGLVGNATARIGADEAITVELPPFGYQWYRVLGRHNGSSPVQGTYEGLGR